MTFGTNITLRLLSMLKYCSRSPCAVRFCKRGSSRQYSNREAEVIDRSLDLSRVRPGQRLDIPYELTIGESWRTTWHSTFYEHCRISTSDIFAQSLGFERALLPFSMMQFVTGSMSHVDDQREVLDLGYRHSVYHRPAYPGETFSKTFYIEDVRESSTGSGCIVDIRCDLSNALTQDTVFTLNKIMFFPNVEVSRKKKTSSRLIKDTILREKVIKSYKRLSTSSTLNSLLPGQVLLHGMNRPIGIDTAMNLETLFRLTHPLHYNTQRYSADEIVVSGGLVMAATHACSARSLYEILHEQVSNCFFLNKVNPKDTIGAISIIEKIDLLENRLEEVTLKTVGIKNLDVVNKFEGVIIPAQVFKCEGLKPSEYERMLKDTFPDLSNNVICLSARKIIRQAPNVETMFLL